MGLNVIIIVIVSTFMHAGWNLLARYDRAEGDFYRKMLIITTLVGFIPALVAELRLQAMTPLAWACVFGSGICAAFYLFGLAKAFGSSDFTIVYPVARALPVIFIAFIDVARGRPLTTIGWIGILLVTTGVLLAPLRSFGDFHLSNYYNRTSLWMILAALGTVGYTFLDKVAAEVVMSGAVTAAIYCYIYFAISYPPYEGLFRLGKLERGNGQRAFWIRASFAAMMGFGAYWLILWAYQLSPYASYIVAFRQFSIVIGTVIAFLYYKEGGVMVRLTGALLITCGMVLIAGWGR